MTRDELSDRAAVIPLGPAELKGKREPVSVYRLLSVTGLVARRAPVPHTSRWRCVRYWLNGQRITDLSAGKTTLNNLQRRGRSNREPMGTSVDGCRQRGGWA